MICRSPDPVTRSLRLCVVSIVCVSPPEWSLCVLAERVRPLEEFAEILIEFTVAVGGLLPEFREPIQKPTVVARRVARRHDL